MNHRLYGKLKTIVVVTRNLSVSHVTIVFVWPLECVGNWYRLSLGLHMYLNFVRSFAKL